MKKSDYKIHIIGAGISGLIAAKVFEENGYQPTIIEADANVGGRVQSDNENGYILDRGFQVLLSSYPAAQKYLDYKSLNLQELLPGATIFKNGKQQTIGDPLRDFSFLFSTLFSSVGTTADKLKILKLNSVLKKKKISAIFNEEEKSTLDYLKDFGFSDAMINNFFIPFFSGIFLEPNLDTSSRMFEFVYKMFGDGLALIPKDGIQAISNQLKDSLQHTEFLFNSSVAEVKNKQITLKDGTTIDNHFTIVATEASSLISNLKNQETEWKSCDTIYFETEKRTIEKPLIGLIADKEATINNIFYHTSIANSSTAKKELLSVTVVKNHNYNKKELLEKVTKDLVTYCNIENPKFIKNYTIKKALPKLNNLQYELSSTETQLTSNIFLAGDQLLNGSLNAAMISGERAAQGVIQTLEDGLIVDELTSDSI
jgi:protoporphyrinogen oxidase